MLGILKIGGDNPIAVQTMTNTLNNKYKRYFSQIERSAKLGADIVRVSVPDKEFIRFIKRNSKTQSCSNCC